MTTKSSRKRAMTTDVDLTATSRMQPRAAFDCGNGYIKIRTADVAAEMRSVIAPLPAASRVGDWPIDTVFKSDRMWWAVGEAAYTFGRSTVEEKEETGRYVSLWYRRLFTGALHRAFHQYWDVETLRPQIISSVPAGVFKQKTIKDAVHKNLVGEYAITNIHGGVLNIVIDQDNLRIVPEGIGTYWQYIYEKDTQNTVFGTGTWMILDLGFMTLDAVFLRDGVYMPDEARSDDNTGTSKIADAVTDFIAAETGVNLFRGEIDSQLACDSIEINRKPIGIAEVRNAAVEALGSRITNYAETWARGKNLNGILFTGGQAPALQQYINSNRLPTLTLARNCRRSNVEGSYLHLLNVLGDLTD